ncbi:MBL fold metallo-hydrolase [Microbacterium sp. NEAU-LLC]|uniref:MBL fold metallo-hydrolase n=1 Tax=Microbacterium helvum TaxID=2773713 RepID=A0ABR8NHM0_9MICO|nr:MBL fold metallo-hydrolase [Microbacterium helvum]MBD3940185.1 MBL fold metallo-hydrolase [Microbacterium helvum]
MERFTPVVDGVFLLKVPFTGVWTGVVLVLGDGAPILIDSGGGAETVDSTIVPALAELGLGLSDIGWVLATHIHGDHVGGIARMRALAPSIRVAVLRESDARMREPLAYSREIRARFPEHSAPPPPVLDGVEPDRLLDDGDMVGPLRTIHTPGHDTDAACFLDIRTGTLITGDSLQLNGTISQGCALLFDPARYLASLQRLLSLPVHNIVCGHPYLPLGEIAIGDDAARRFLATCIGCYEHDRGFVAGMTRAGVTDPLTVAQALVADVGGVEPAKMFLPMHTVAAYQYAAQREHV